MADNWKKFTLASAAALVAAFSVACGTRGNNIDNPQSTVGGLVNGTGTTATTTTTTTTTGVSSNLTGGFTGGATNNVNAQPTTLTGLVTTNIIAANAGTGLNNPVTRLAQFNFNGQTGAIVAQSNAQPAADPLGQALPRTLGEASFPSPVPIRATSGNAGQIVSPFDVLVANDAVYFTDNSNSATNGRVLRVASVDASGNAQVDRIAQGMAFPIDMVFDQAANNGQGLIYVANYIATTGRISIADPNNPPAPGDTATAASTLISGLNFPSSVALDTSNGNRFLYFTENQGTGTAGSGQVLRADLNHSDFVAALQNPNATGVVLNTGLANGSIQVVQQDQTNDPGSQNAFNNPWEVEVDQFGNLVIAEGFRYSPQSPGTSVALTNGRIRVMPAGSATLTARTVVVGLVGPRGLSIVPEGPAGGSLTGTDLTAFFVTGTVNQQSDVRQLTFSNTAGIYRYLTLAAGIGFSALDTLFDVGGGSTPANLKVTINFVSPPNGQVIDIR